MTKRETGGKREITRKAIRVEDFRVRGQGKAKLRGVKGVSYGVISRL